MTLLHARHWIDGEWVDTSNICDSIDPATGEKIGTYTEAGEVEAERAIAAARRAFRESAWRGDRAQAQARGATQGGAA